MKILIVLPVLNEEDLLEGSVHALRAFVQDAFPEDEVRILVVDNGSDDATPEIATRLSSSFPDVGYLRLERRGKGLAIREGWGAEEADVYAFMDADLSTGLGAFPGLVFSVREHGGIAVGSRFHPDSEVDRAPFRRMVSRGYRAWLKTVLSTGFEDAPCGFKAVSPCVVRDILPSVEDDGWFFDTELLVRSERAGSPVRELPVQWTDSHDRSRPSRVAVFRLAAEYVRKTLRLRRRLL